MTEKAKSLVAELEPIIRQYIKVRGFIETEQKKLKARLVEFAKSKEVLGNYLASVLIQNKLDSVSATVGTAYTAERVEYKVVDATAFLRWLRESNDPDIWEKVKIEPIVSEIDAYAQKRLEDYIAYVQSANVNPETVKPTFEQFLPPGLNRKATVSIRVRKKGEIDDAS